MIRSFRLIYSGILAVISMAVLVTCGQTDNAKDAAIVKSYKHLDGTIDYVGMAKCRQCHSDKFETFIHTGMGQSFDAATKEKSSGNFENHPSIYDKHTDLYYHPYWLKDSLYIIEYRLNGRDTTHKRIERVDYIIGSGQHTNSHLFSSNCYIHQMPLTYFTQKGKWDLPPGFENGYNSRFSRKIGLECMSCHNGYPEFVQGSENKFTKVPNGIDCERCHGPGALHVKEKEAGILVDTSKEIDYSIVNPGKLTAELQFDLCQRCHLQGNTVLKPGKSFYDFKPGMKLSDVMTVFLPKYEGADDEFIMASHADRLKMSACYLATAKNQSSGSRPHKNQMTCITCHNPHVSVKETGATQFNSSCAGCHSSPKNGCTAPETSRKANQDNCVSCHMPRNNSIDIPHVTVTDHFIRKPKVPSVDKASIRKFIALHAVNEQNPAPSIRAEAFLNQFEKFDKQPFLLDSAQKLISGHDPEMLALLIRLHYLKRDWSSLAKVDASSLLQRQQSSEKYAWACYQVAEAYQRYNDLPKAMNYFQKAVSLAPYNLEFQNKLAGMHYAAGEIEKAREIYEWILKEDPKFAPAWCNVGFIHLQQNNPDVAKICYEKAIALDPDYTQALLNMAGWHIFKKDNKSAAVMVKRVLKIDPMNPQARELSKRLSL